MKLQGLALYEYMSCGYCARVRSALDRLGVDLERRDIQRDRDHLRDLVEATGRTTVPCLRIELEGEGDVEWMHESGDIVRYLEERAAALA